MSIKRLITIYALSIIFCFFMRLSCYGQESGSITVGGDINTFYPVTWGDGGYQLHKQTELHIGRSSVHMNSQWRGSMIAEFNYHTTNWGNGSNFINGHIISSQQKFVAGWKDPTSGNSGKKIIIWLRGGGTTYYYNSNVTVAPVVYDDEQNALPFVTHTGNASYDVKTSIDDYVNDHGTVLDKPLHVRTGKSVFMGMLGIGTTTPDSKLSVNGNIRAREIKLETDNWPDYVFEEGYKQMSLEEVEAFIKEHEHLPGLKSAEEYKREGVHMMELNQQLLEKIEELTLHLIDLKKENSTYKSELSELRSDIEMIKQLLSEKE